MKIGKHYEIQKVTKEDLSLLAESLNIKYSVLSKIFDDFAKKHINAFEELKNDEKNSRELLNSIFEVASKSLKSHLNDFEVKIVFRPIILYFLYFLLCYYNN